MDGADGGARPGAAGPPSPWRPASWTLAVAGALLAPLALHWGAGRTLAWFDTLRLYAPERWLVEEALRGLRLPLWNPYMAGGVPLLADAVHGVLHPVSIAAAWLATDRAVDVMIGGYVLLAGLGAAALARELGASSVASALAGVVYGSSGFVLSMAGNLVFLAGLGSLPLCLAGLRRFAVAPGAGSLALGAAGAAVLALSGDAQALMIGGALTLLLSWEAAGWRGAVRAAAAGTAGLLVAGIQLLPTAVHLPRTDRASAGWDPGRSIWALEPWRLAELVVPGLLGGADPLMDQVYGALAGPGRWPAGGLPYPFAASVFVGIVPLALGAAAVRGGRRWRLLGVAAVVLLWIALGPALGADVVTGRIPIWRHFRYSEKLVGPLTLVVSLLAAGGLDVVAARRATGRFLLGVAAAGGLVALAACRLAARELPPDLAAEAAGRIGTGTWHAVLAVAALGGWVLVRARLGPGRDAAALAALAWAATLAATPAALRPGDPEARLRAPGPVLEAGPPGPRIVTPYSYEPLTLPAGEEWIDRALRDYAANGYPALNVRSRLDSMEEYVALVPARLAELKGTLGPRWPAAARRYGVTHVIVEAPRSETHLALHAMATAGGAVVGRGTATSEVWSVPHREWASFAAAVRTVQDPGHARAETARAIAAGDAAVVVEAYGRFDAGPGVVHSVERGLEAVRIEAEASGDATLVVADTWWPGWEATLDGQPVAIFRADYLVRAVRWPPGRHVLEMRYRPPEVRTGWVVSGLGLLVVAAWAALLRRRARRSSEDRPGSAPSAGTAGP